MDKLLPSCPRGNGFDVIELIFASETPVPAPLEYIRVNSCLFVVLNFARRGNHE